MIIPTKAEKSRLRAYYSYQPIRFRKDGTVYGKKGVSWGLLLTSKQWQDTILLWRKESNSLLK